MLITKQMIATSSLYIGSKLGQKRHKKNQLFLKPAAHHDLQQPVLPLSLSGTLKQASQRYLSDTSGTFLPIFGKTRRQQLSEIASTNDELTNKKVDQQINLNLTIASASAAFSAIGALGFPLFSLLSLPGLFFISVFGLIDAYKSLTQKRRLNVDCIVAIVRVLLFVNGYIFYACLSTLSYAVNRKMLTAVKDHSRQNVIDMFRQQPRSAWVLIDGNEIECPVETLEKGHIVVVNAGETLAVDGVVVAGMALIDQRILTGESQPAEKESGDEVFALTTLLSGRLQVRVKKTGEETTAARIAQVLNCTIDIKTDMQLWVETMSDKTVLPTLLLGSAAFPFRGAIGSAALFYCHPFYKGIIAGAMDMLTFLNVTSRNGVLVKDGRTFELMQQVDTVVFDKTGTLTQEQPHIGQIYALPSYAEDDIVYYAATAETKQTHPIALAIQREAGLRHLELPDIEEAAYVVGYGISVKFANQVVQVGSPRFMEKEGLTIPVRLKAVQAESYAQGSSVIMVAVEHRVIGAIELRPTVRPEAAAVIRRLRQCGIASIYIISGDHEFPTKKLADELGLDRYFAETLPEQKAVLIQQLQRSGKSVCYVGDGINDAIALKEATVSISLRGASTVATDAAQVILMDESLRHLSQFFDLSQQFQNHVRTTFLAVLIPHFISMGGVFFFHLGFLPVFLLAQVGLLAGLLHALSPVSYPDHQIPTIPHMNRLGSLARPNSEDSTKKISPHRSNPLIPA